MSTVFSHIVQKHLSQEYENVATDALAFLLGGCPAAKRGLMRLLRGVDPGLPDLQFRTQVSEGSARPDMWGMDGSQVRVLIENKFWAGLTDHQPVSYLRIFESSQPNGVLLFIVPAARQGTVWQELLARISASGESLNKKEPTTGFYSSARVGDSNVLALTSWEQLISSLELEAANEPKTLAELYQLRALCKAADDQAFVPFSGQELSDQRLPAIVLQLNSITEEAVRIASEMGSVARGNLRPSANWERIGRYLSIQTQEEEPTRFGAFLGVDFVAWRRLGRTPMWLEFWKSSPAPEWACGEEAIRRINANPDSVQLHVGTIEERFLIGIHVPAGEEKDRAAQVVAKQLTLVSRLLSKAS